MRTFEEWIIENHPEIDEAWMQDLASKAGEKIRKGVGTALLGASLAGIGGMGNTAQAANPSSRPVAAATQQQDNNVIVKGNWVYIRGVAPIEDNTPEAMNKAYKNASDQEILNTAKYFKKLGFGGDQTPGMGILGTVPKGEQISGYGGQSVVGITNASRGKNFVVTTAYYIGNLR